MTTKKQALATTTLWTLALAPRGALAALAALGACTLTYPLDAPPPPVPLAIAAKAPLDILFVVDNSGSMVNEQQTLIRSIYDERCPIADLNDVQPQFRDAPPPVLSELASVCGLAQLMAAVDGDFHIGVITTDVGNCDERFPPAQDLDDSHTPTPMRGCLQGAVNASGKKFLTRDDDVQQGLQDAMLGVGLYGSSFERGMDAMQIFLDDDSRRAPGCEDDLDGFLRKDGQLLVIFVGDEDDCSHKDGAYGFRDELAGEPAGCGDFPELFTVQPGPNACYEDQDHLAPVADYSDFLLGLKSSGRTSDVFVGVVGGLVDLGGNGFVPGGCVPDDDDGTASAICTPVFGTAAQCDAADNCCFADGAYRYAALAAAVNSEALLGSICTADFRAPLLPIFFESELGTPVTE